MTQDEALAALTKATKKYEKAQKARDEAMAALVAAMRDADEAGVYRNEIVRRSGLARQTVYGHLSVRSEVAQ